MWAVLFFKQKTAYDMRISDWSSDVCSSDLGCRSSPPPSAAGWFRSPVTSASRSGADKRSRLSRVAKPPHSMPRSRRHERGWPWRNRRSEKHTTALQSLMRISYAVFCSQNNKTHNLITTNDQDFKKLK